MEAVHPGWVRRALADLADDLRWIERRAVARSSEAPWEDPEEGCRVAAAGYSGRRAWLPAAEVPVAGHAAA